MINFLKKWLLEKGLKFLLISIALGVGVWYLSHSLGGASLSYTSVDAFMKQIGASDGDVSSVNGCFLCIYIQDLFNVLGRATEMFWNGIVRNLWIVMAVGFGIFIIFHTFSFIREQAASKDIKDLTNNEIKLDFKKWFDKVWKTGMRVLIAGALIGALNWTGTSTLKIVTNATVAPVMYIGTTFSMVATGVITNAKCEMPKITEKAEDILNPVSAPFMCVVGNLNTVMLAGAGGGFALMNYSWLDLNGQIGGVFTWLAGLALVLLFLVIGFDLLFKVLNVFFKLVFIIIFMPLLIAAAAFEEVWKLAKGLMDSAINILVNSAISILKISLKITIIFAVVYFAADKFYPGPEDGFTSIMPPLIASVKTENMDTQALSVMKAFSTCEQVSLDNGEMNKAKFAQCFITQRKMVEQKYPHAFDFMDDGLDFFLFMLGVFILYFWVVSPQIDSLLGSESSETFNYGEWVKDAVKRPYDWTMKAYDKIYDKIKNKG